MSNLLGIRIIAIGPDFIIGEMPVDERTKQPFGLLHGGASMVLAETLASYASSVLAHDEAGAKITGVEISGSHLRSAHGGRVIGVCRALKLGRTLHFWQIDISDEEGQLCCSAKLVVFVSRKNADTGAT